MTQHVILRGNYQRKLAKELIDKAPDNAVVRISEARRSLEQNDKMHAMLSDIARAKPEGRVYTAEIWKCLFMDECGFKPRWIPSLDGQSVVNTGFRSSRLTIREMSDLIECMYAFGAQHGIEWTDEKR